MVVEDIYNEFPNRLQTGAVAEDLNTTAPNVALLDASHSPDVANNATWADVSANDISNTGSNSSGYSLGGKQLTNFSITADSANRNVDADGDDVTWSSSTIDAGYAVVYNNGPSTDADKDLIMLVDFEGEQSSSSAEFTISWDTAGIWRFDTNPA